MSVCKRHLAVVPAAILMLLAEGVAAETTATVRKPTVDVHAQPSFEAPKVATLQRDAPVSISAQQGLWYELRVPAGFVRVNDVRVDQAAVENGDANVRALLGNKSGAGRVTETAGVRGIDESELKAASLDQAQLDAMVQQRVSPSDAASHAAAQGWQATPVAFAGESSRGKGSSVDAAQISTVQSASNMLGSVGRSLGSVLGGVAKAMPKSEQELAAEELALGPQIAGRILGARPLLADEVAQRRVSAVGRWVASQTSRPDLPWTFGVLDSDEVNAFAAPGGYVLITRGLYELLSSDEELAAVLGHEISHCVARDHYRVIRKQQLATAGKDTVKRELALSAGSPAEVFAANYAEQHGASIMLTSLDREAEYLADQAAGIYVARSGMNPLALYAVLQKMAALGTQSAKLTQLYRTHPPIDARLDRLDQQEGAAAAP